MPFSRLKTPPIIHTEQELKKKIALLEVNRLSNKYKQGMVGVKWASCLQEMALFSTLLYYIWSIQYCSFSPSFTSTYTLHQQNIKKCMLF